MDHVGIDLGKKESQIAILTEAGELVEASTSPRRARVIWSVGFMALSSAV